MKNILFILCLGLSGCQGMDSDWLQRFYNNTTEDIYILINQRREGIYVYPDYGELPENLANRGEGNSVSYNCIQGSGWEPPCIIYYTLTYNTKINRGDCIHVYAFHADTLKKYTWEEIRTSKKYWFRETVCQSTDIQFPDGFKYMEESDAENP